MLRSLTANALVLAGVGCFIATGFACWWGAGILLCGIAAFAAGVMLARKAEP